MVYGVCCQADILVNFRSATLNDDGDIPSEFNWKAWPRGGLYIVAIAASVHSGAFLVVAVGMADALFTKNVTTSFG